jgi:hypothetical protein
VNALPGGLPVRDVMTNHSPGAEGAPGIVVVGDYLFDLDAQRAARPSDAATDIIVTK